MVNEQDYIIKKYNWVDAEVLAKRFFFGDSPAGMNWLRDTWNVLMFGTSVREDNIAKSNHPVEDKAEILTWLLACYDLYCDFEVIVGKRTYYEKNNGEITDYQKDIILSLRDKELLLAIVNNYLKKQVNYLNYSTSTYPGHYSAWKDREIKEELKKADFVTTHFTTNHEVLTGVYVNHAIFSQVLTKRNNLIYTINKHFDNDTEKIIFFMTGHHWRKKYSNYNEMEHELYRKKDKLEKIDKYDQIALFLDPLQEDSHQQLDIFKTSAEDYFEAKLQELKEKNQVSIEKPNEIKDKPANNFLPSLREWIHQKMPHLHNL
ncbi:hypothetical protein [Metabacillus litoralis]|uniref:hypothetical protein n=1 Tax=Metabacillus litoralis TaxID=152268 RepID=UPI000EF5E2C3|nr:hypothetical protein [Metabacillus litoralis]